MPRDQVRFLECLDSVDVPHDRAKQLFGTSLPIIGLEVNRNALQITMPKAAKLESETLPMISMAHIFFHEAYAVVCALHCACHSGAENLRRVVICTDNTNTVDIFSSLKASGIYNHLLQFAVSLLMQTKVDLRVVHIPGDTNHIADHLSRFCVDVARALHPTLKIMQSQPPAIMVEADF